MGLNNEFRITELINSGSTAIKSQDSEGKHRFNVSSPLGDNDGEIYGYLERPVYNEEEVKKSSTNTDINELIRNTQTTTQDEVVLRSVYDTLSQQFDDLSDQLSTQQELNNLLQSQVNSLESTNVTLQSQIESLETVINQLRDSLSNISSRLSTEIEQKSELQIKVSELEAEIARLNALLEAKIAEIKGKEEMISTLQATLASGTGGAGSAGEEVDGLGGYIQIDETEVYVKFDGDEVGGNDDFIKGSRFYADQRDNGKANGRVNQIDAPNLIRIKNNTDEPKEMQFFENWLNSDRGPDYEKYKQPIEVFVIGEDFDSKYTNRAFRKFTIPPRTELVSQVVPQSPTLFSSPYGIGRKGGKVTRHQGDFEIRNLTDNKVKKFKMAIRRDYS